MLCSEQNYWRKKHSPSRVTSRFETDPRRSPANPDSRLTLIVYCNPRVWGMSIHPTLQPAIREFRIQTFPSPEREIPSQACSLLSSYWPNLRMAEDSLPVCPKVDRKFGEAGAASVLLAEPIDPAVGWVVWAGIGRVLRRPATLPD